MEIEKNFQALEEKGREKLSKQNFANEEIFFERILHMRYEKTDCVLMCSPKGACMETIVSDIPTDEISQEDGLNLFKKNFMEMYKREFGFVIFDRVIIVDDIR